MRIESEGLEFRIGDTLLIKAAATGKAVPVENFFNGHGIDILRFADGTELDRTHITDASVFRRDGDSAGDDVIHGAQGDDLIHIGGGNDTILYGKGDGYDVVTDSSNSPTEHDTFILTDINPMTSNCRGSAATRFRIFRPSSSPPTIMMSTPWS